MARYMPVIILDRCKGCQLCVHVCPRRVLHIGSKRNRMGYLVPEVRDPSRCIGCRNCELTCPDFAIYVVEVE